MFILEILEELTSFRIREEIGLFFGARMKMKKDWNICWWLENEYLCFRVRLNDLLVNKGGFRAGG